MDDLERCTAGVTAPADVEEMDLVERLRRLRDCHVPVLESEMAVTSEMVHGGIAHDTDVGSIVESGTAAGDATAVEGVALSPEMVCGGSIDSGTSGYVGRMGVASAPAVQEERVAAAVVDMAADPATARVVEADTVTSVGTTRQESTSLLQEEDGAADQWSDFPALPAPCAKPTCLVDVEQLRPLPGRTSSAKCRRCGPEYAETKLLELRQRGIVARPVQNKTRHLTVVAYPTQSVGSSGVVARPRSTGPKSCGPAADAAAGTDSRCWQVKHADGLPVWLHISNGRHFVYNDTRSPAETVTGSLQGLQLVDSAGCGGHAMSPNVPNAKHQASSPRQHHQKLRKYSESCNNHRTAAAQLATAVPAEPSPASVAPARHHQTVAHRAVACGKGVWRVLCMYMLMCLVLQSAVPHSTIVGNIRSQTGVLPSAGPAVVHQHDKVLWAQHYLRVVKDSYGEGQACFLPDNCCVPRAWWELQASCRTRAHAVHGGDPYGVAGTHCAAASRPSGGWFILTAEAYRRLGAAVDRAATRRVCIGGTHKTASRFMSRYIALGHGGGRSGCWGLLQWLAHVRSCLAAVWHAQLSVAAVAQGSWRCADACHRWCRYVAAELLTFAAHDVWSDHCSQPAQGRRLAEDVPRTEWRRLYKRWRGKRLHPADDSWATLHAAALRRSNASGAWVIDPCTGQVATHSEVHHDLLLTHPKSLLVRFQFNVFGSELLGTCCSRQYGLFVQQI